jgi:multiple sugar transport system permease protein
LVRSDSKSTSSHLLQAERDIKGRRFTAFSFSWRRLTFYLGIFAILFVAVFPFFWVGLSSIKASEEIVTSDLKFWFSPTLENYREVWDPTFRRAFQNSVIITVSNVLLAIVLGAPAAYAISRYRFFGRGLLFGTTLATRFLPYISFALPLYIIFMSLGLVGTHLAIILAYLIFNLPLVIWMMKSFFDEVPTSLEEAALIDGCSRPRAFLQIVLPTMAGPIAAMTILTFIFAWNHYVFGLILSGRNSQTVVVLASQYQGGPDWGISWGPLAAASFSITAPVVFLAMALNKYVVQGLTGGKAT